MNSPRIYASAVFLSVCLLLSGVFFAGAAWGEESRWDLGLGGGFNLDGADSGHLLLAPGVSGDIPGQKFFKYRIEGDLELISRKGEVTVVAGVAPFIQVIRSSGDVKPFFEIGGGPNLISRTHIGPRKLGGGFIFSLMAGAGVELKSPSSLSLSVRFRHLSNGGIFRFNHSINSLLLMVSTRL